MKKKNKIKKIVIICNPKAGKKKKYQLINTVKEKLENDGIEVVIIFSHSPLDAKKIAIKYASLEYIIVACGGDGHVNVLAEIAAKYNSIFGVIPAGSGNDFAKSLGIETLDDITSSLRNDNVKFIDLWEINNRIFCSIANIGFSSYANKWANNRKFLRGKLLYFASVFMTIINFRPIDLRITIDDGSIIEKKVWLIAVANTSLFGGGMNIAPYASPFDGFLDLISVGPVKRLEFLKTFPSVYRGEHTNHPSVSFHRGKNIYIENKKNIDHSIFADGEDFGCLPVKISLSRFKLKQLVPKKLS